MRGLISSLLVAAAAAVVVAGTPVSATAGGRGLAVELEAVKADLTTSEDVLVRFTVRNDGDRGRAVYLWHTPLAEIENDLFLVTRDGERVAYLGYVAKRGPQTRADFVQLGPGQSRSTVVELSSLYDMSQPGVYAVQYRASVTGRVEPGRVEANAAGDAAGSNEIFLRLTGAPRESAAGFDSFLAERAVTAAGTTVYRNCTASQQTTLAQVRPAAQNYAANAYSSLTGTAGTRYTTWFGAYNSSRYSTVKSHYQSLNSALTNQTFTFDCGCKKQYYAYVYPNRPYEVFLCRVFWNAPLTGTDSKAGTVVHETSHFTVVASTDDWAYGQSACKSLAISSPAKAIDNADSHEYYAENNPVLK